MDQEIALNNIAENDNTQNQQQETIRFSVILYIDQVNSVFFRDCLDSINAGVYRNFELVIVDSAGSAYGTPEEETNGYVAGEFFPEKGRLKYYRVRPGKSRGYCLNLAVNYARGDYLLFMDHHSRMSPGALGHIATAIYEKKADFIYSDQDELVGDNRMNPFFKSGPNRELIRHMNYIGEFFAISTEAMLKVGAFKDALDSAAGYEFILRAFENRLNICHIPKLLFSKRIFNRDENPKDKNLRLGKSYREHMTVARAHLQRIGVEGEVRPSKRGFFWQIDYDGSGYRSRSKDYLLVREGGTRVNFRESLQKMYGHLRQPDVGIVGVAFLKGMFTYENCGYIFDEKGICYPACNGQSVFLDGYQYRCIIPQDVSAVDFGYCLIKKKVFRHLRGFDTNLTGRDMMLDFCLRVKRAGYRVVFEPGVRVMRRKVTHESSAESNQALMEKLGDIIAGSDPYYNRNLPMGLENYIL